jgi:hypothetical protein
VDWQSGEFGNLKFDIGLGLEGKIGIGFILRKGLKRDIKCTNVTVRALFARECQFFAGLWIHGEVAACGNMG